MKSFLVIPVLFAGLSLAAAAAADNQAPAAAEAPDPLAGKGVDEGLSRAIVEKLTREQLVEVLKQHEKTKVAEVERSDPKEHIAVLVPFGFFACALGLLALPLYYRYRKHREQQVTLRLMVEKGATIPVELLAPPAPAPRSDLRRGVLLVATGLGVGLFLKAVHAGPGAWSLGLVPFLIGVGYLVVWRFTPPAEESPASPPSA